MQRHSIKYVLLFGLIAASWPTLTSAGDKVTEIDTLGGPVVVHARESVATQGKVKWKKTGANSIEVVVPPRYVVERTEDVGRDGVIEMWVVEGNPDSLSLDLYQIDVRSIRAEKVDLFHDAKISLSALASADDPFLSVQFQDVDGKGTIEIIVRTPTKTQGTPYQQGKLKWEDIYDLDPWPKLANARYKSFFKKKREDIIQEIARAEKYALESEKRAELEKDESYQAIELLHATEVREQVKNYREWLKRIELILQENS